MSNWPLATFAPLRESHKLVRVALSFLMNVIELAHCANGAQLGEAEHSSEKIRRTTVQRSADSIGKELYKIERRHKIRRGMWEMFDKCR